MHFNTYSTHQQIDDECVSAVREEILVFHAVFMVHESAQCRHAPGVLCVMVNPSIPAIRICYLVYSCSMCVLAVCARCGCVLTRSLRVLQIVCVICWEIFLLYSLDNSTYIQDHRQANADGNSR